MTRESGGMDTEGHSRDFPTREPKREFAWNHFLIIVPMSDSIIRVYDPNQDRPACVRIMEEVGWGLGCLSRLKR